ncbi:MAG: hypothetical protein FWD18_01545 [Micrococcales bacterium]|nr:hypothetical protein [Micrococcales bacterium]
MAVTTPTSVTGIAADLRGDVWCPGGPERFRTDFATGSVHGMVSWLLDYAWPLNTWLDQLMGDEAQVGSFATTWHQASSTIATMRTELGQARAQVAHLEGLMADALEARLTQADALLREAAEWTGATAVALEHASRIITNLHDSLAGAISELMMLAGSLLNPFQWDLNPFDGNDQIDAILRHSQNFIELMGGLLDAMFDAFENLLALLAALDPRIAALIDQARTVAAMVAMPLGMAGGATVGGLVLGPLGAVAGGALGALFGSAASDLLAPAPEVRRLDPADASDPTGIEESNVSRITSVTDLIFQNGATDKLGGTEASAVDIKKVRAPDGSIHYIVSLPSTKDWGLIKGLMNREQLPETFVESGVTNDMDGNLNLIVAPYASTLYERGVMRAMADAGIPPGADVVYTGYSQGGIMAANLGSDINSPYNTIGVITNGSPIDLYSFPPDVPVLAFQHENDVVPKLDGNVTGRGDGLNRSTVTLPAPTGHADMRTGQPDPDPHSILNYTDSVRTYLAGNPEVAERFAFINGEVVDHQQFTWSATHRS